MIFSANCSAVDYYVGNYDDGSKAYLMTEIILRHDVTATDGTGYVEFTFKVKAVYSNSVKIDNYHFDVMGGIFKVNEKVKLQKWNTVESNIYRYLMKK